MHGRMDRSKGRLGASALLLRRGRLYFWPGIRSGRCSARGCWWQRDQVGLTPGTVVLGPPLWDVAAPRKMRCWLAGGGRRGSPPVGAAFWEPGSEGPGPSFRLGKPARLQPSWCEAGVLVQESRSFVSADGTVCVCAVWYCLTYIAGADKARCLGPDLFQHSRMFFGV